MREEARSGEPRGGGEAPDEENEEATLTVIMKKKRGKRHLLPQGLEGKNKKEKQLCSLYEKIAKNEKLFFYLFC